MSDIGILTQFLTTFLGITSGGYGRILPAVNWLLGTFVTIEIVFFGLMVSVGRANLFTDLFFKTLKIGFFIWLVTNFPVLHQAFMQSMIQLGILAGGGNLATSFMYDPSAIAQQGLFVTEPLFRWFESLQGFSAVKALPSVIITGLCSLVIIFCFFIMAIQVFVTLLEFYIVSLLALVLIPWGMLKQTAFMAEKAIGIIVAFSVKLMVLAFVLSVAQPTIEAIALMPNPEYRHIFGLVLGSLGLTYLAWQVPSVAAGLMMGGPSLNAGSAVMTMAGMAMGGIILAQGTKRLAESAVSGSLGAVRAATSVAGAARAGALMGSSTAVGGPWAKFGGGVSGAAQGVVGGAMSGLKETSRHSLQGLQESFTSAYQRGAQSGFLGSGGTTESPWVQDNTDPANRKNSKAPAWALQAASNTNTAMRMMSSTTSPSGGMSPKL